jgi:hypothetical protein
VPYVRSECVYVRDIHSAHLGVVDGDPFSGAEGGEGGDDKGSATMIIPLHTHRHKDRQTDTKREREGEGGEGGER